VSTTVAATQEQLDAIPLNEAQADAIIDYAIKGGLYRGTPRPEYKINEARQLVWHARRVHDVGNNGEVVMRLLEMANQIDFVASVDQRADNVPAPPPDPAAAFAPDAQAPQNGTGDSTYVNCTDEQLVQMLQGLEPSAHNPSVKAEIEKIQAIQRGRQQVAASPQAQVAPSAPPMPAPPQSPPVPSQPSAGVVSPVPAPGGLQPGVIGALGQPSPPADAAGPVAAPASPAPDRRAGLEAQLTGGILMAYGRTFADVAGISDDDMERMIAFPGGPQPTPQEAPSALSQVSAEREALEEQITGPALKAHKRGRRDIPDLSDEELRWIIEHPQGPPWPGPASGPVPQPTVQEPVFTPTPPTTPMPGVSATPVPPTVAPMGLFAPTETQLPSTVMVREGGELDGEHMFPDVAKPPQVPPDLSQLDDVDLRSLQGKFHAVLARANWVIAKYKDEIHDLERALVLKRAAVRDSLPKTMDGKRVTKDDAAAMVETHPEVVALSDRISQAKKPLIKMEAVAVNARSTCARCSRDWAMRKGEQSWRDGE
jgi:hypothetical protein